MKIEPKDNAGIGTWGGTTQHRKDGAFEFKGVPPGQYIVVARPNPMRESEAAEPKLVTVTMGTTVSLEITAHPNGDYR